MNVTNYNSIFDGVHSGLAFKAPVVAVSSSQLTLSGLQTVSGVVLAEGDRVLERNQSDTRLNGIYNASTGLWARAADADGSRDLVNGTLIFSTSNNRAYRTVCANPCVFGTTGITFVDFFGATGEIYFNVKNYGAVGDGTTDDRVAIQEAVDAAFDAGGGVVYFPPGTYIVSRFDGSNAYGINLRSRVHLMGDGPGISIIKAEAGTGNIHLLTNWTDDIEYVSITRLTVDHDGANIGASTGVHAIRFVDADRIWIQHVEVRNAYHHSICTISSSGDVNEVMATDYHISDLYIYNSGEDAIRLFLGAARVVVNNIIADGCGGHGVHLGGPNALVSNVVVKNAANTGLSIQSEGVLASNIHCEVDQLTCDLFANRPVTGATNDLFYASDTTNQYRWNGVEWVEQDLNLTGVWLFTRAGGFNTMQRTLLTNIKTVLNVTENEPYTKTTGDGIRFDGPKCSLGQFVIQGKYRFGIYAEDTADYTSISGGSIEGVRQDASRCESLTGITFTGVSVQNCGLQTAATYVGFQFRQTTDAKVIGCHVLQGDLRVAIEESTGASPGLKVIGSSFTTANFATSGSYTCTLHNSGFVTNGVGNVTIPSGSTSVVVTHGCSATPSATRTRVTARENPTNNVGLIWVDNFTSTEFTINCENDPGASNLDLSWNIHP